MTARYSIISKFAFFFLCFIFFTSTQIKSISAAEPYWSNQSSRDFDPKTLNAASYNTMTMNNTFRSIGCEVMFDPFNTEHNLCYIPEDKKLIPMIYQRSALAQVQNAIVYTYANPPASTVYYAMDVMQRLGVPSAYAQGLGAGGLIPLLPLWNAFRNVAYGIIIIILMAIGIMIMFRVPIDSHTVISVQQSLPRVVISLVLIMFSYPIAGLMIDVMYLVMQLAIYIVYTSIPNVGTSHPSLSEIQSLYITGGATSIMQGTFSLIPIDQVIKGLGLVGLPVLISKIPAVGAIAAVFVSLTLGAAMSGVPAAQQGPLGEIIPSAVGGFVSPLVYLIIGLGLLFMFIRILFLVINAYVQVIVAVIFAPIQILFDAFPIGGGNFSGWFKNLVANLAVFPTIVILLLVGQAINSTIGYTQGAFSRIWVPPLVPGWTPNAIKFIIGIGLVTLIPTIVGSIKEVIGGKPPVPLGIGAPFAPFMSGAQHALQAGQSFYYIQHALGPVQGFLGRKHEEAPPAKRQ